MIDYINENLFRKDSISKEWNIYIDGTLLNNADLYSESIEINESLCSESNILFGLCESSNIKFTTSNISTSFKGKEIHVSLVLDGDYENPFTVGTYFVVDETLTSDRTKKEIVAYDYLYLIINKNIKGWYDSLSYPLSLKDFRDYLFSEFDIEQETTTLVNDNLLVEKTIDAEVISGADVLKAICEINGVLGHINRNGIFEYKSLGDSVDYTITASMYSYCEYADYSVQPIDKLQIREESGDIGVVVGTGDNDYIIEDNFLVYGKSSTDMESIATNILNVIDNITFVPVRVNCIGNPCAEVGDRVEIIKTDNVSIETYILQRTIKGVQFLADEITSDGDETYPDNVNGINTDIIQLKGKSNVLERTIEETRSTIRDVEQGLQTEIRQTAEGLEIEIQDLQSQIDGEIEYYEREGTPTLLNYPYWDFTSSFKSDGTKKCAPIYNDNMTEGGEEYPHFYYSETDKQNHQRDLVFDSLNAVSYRFNKVNGEWIWQEVADGETTYILSEISTLKATAQQLESQYTQISVDLSGNYYTKVQTESRITQTANQIQTTVSQTYATKTTTTSLQSQITQQASQISAKVSETGGSSSSFGWYLKSDKFELKSRNRTVLLVNSSGIQVDGVAVASSISALSGRIGSLEADHVTVNQLNAVSSRVGSLEADHVTVSQLNAVNAKFSNLNADNITAGSLKANHIDINSVAGAFQSVRFACVAISASSAGTFANLSIYHSGVSRYATLYCDTNGYVKWR